MNKYFCKNCGLEMWNPDRLEHDDGFTRYIYGYGCPKCGSPQVEPMGKCPACDGGWKRIGEKVCGKCRLRLLGDLQRFAREHTPVEQDVLDDMLEGNGLEQFKEEI